MILSSPATRALKTAEIIAKKLDCRRKDIVVNERLYAADADDLLDVIHKLGDKLECVMLFGHNPEMTELAQRFSSEITHLPTCAVAEFRFDATVVVKHRQGHARKSGARLSKEIVAAKHLGKPPAKASRSLSLLATVSAARRLGGNHVESFMPDLAALFGNRESTSGRFHVVAYVAKNSSRSATIPNPISGTHRAEK